MADAETLFAEHQAGVLRYFRRVAGQAEAARDLSQELFLRVARAGVPDCPPDQRRAWVFRIARNLALNYHRDRASRPEPTVLVDHGTPAPQDIKVAVREALDELDPLDRDVFLLREVVGLNYEEIAAACELTAPAVRSRVHRARLELRAILTAPIRIRRSKPMQLNSFTRKASRS